MHFLMWLAIGTASPGSLQDEPGLGGQFETARSVGMGGAQRAIADGLDALYLNPAGMSQRPQYLFGGTFQWNPLPQEYIPSVGLVDSATTSVAAGLGYGFDRRAAPDTGVMDIHRFHLAASYSLGGVVNIGLTMKYYTYKREKPSLVDVSQRTASLSSGSLRDGSVVALQGADDLTFDLGMLVTPIPQFTLAVVGYNLLPKCDTKIPQIDKSGKQVLTNGQPTLVGFPNNVPGGCLEREIAPLALAVGAALKIAGLGVDVDAVFDFWTRAQMEPRFHFGAEYTLFDIVPLRAGAIVDRVQDEIFWTAGAGLNLSQVGFDLGYRQGTQVSDNRTLIATIRLSLN